MTCESKNVIYVMKYIGCGNKYIGETGNFLRERVTVHNQQIRNPKTRMLYVSEHMCNYARQFNPKYYMFPFYKMYFDNASLRPAKEMYKCIKRKNQ